MIGGGGDTTIQSPGMARKQPLSGIGLHAPLHGRQACPEFNSFHRGFGQISPPEGLFSCRPLLKRGQICYIPAPSQSLSGSEQHVCDLRRFLERLTRFGLKLAPNKALLGAAEIIVLGHKISSEGVGPDPGKIKAMKEMPMPQNGSQLRSLLGALWYY